MGGNVTFKGYITLLEGGNIEFGSKSADTIDLTKFQRNEVVELIKQALHLLNTDFEKTYGLTLWQTGLLNSGEMFSGSARHLFDENIPSDEFIQHKSKVGDIDTMVDLELQDYLEEFLDVIKGKTRGEVKLIDWKNSPDQLITLWKLKPFNINVQIDFEFVAFIDGKPSEWSNFSHSSAWSDIKGGVKGVFHKFLMMSLLAPKAELGVEQLVRNDPNTGKPKEKEFFGTEHAISIKGIRKKFEKQPGETREITDLDGQTKKVPVFKQTKSKNFIQDVSTIFMKAFDKRPSVKELEDFNTFDGIAKLIKTNLSKEAQQAIFDKFYDKLFGDGAQGLYIKDPQRDLDDKMIAVRALADKLKIKVSPQQEAQRKDYVETYK